MAGKQMGAYMYLRFSYMRFSYSLTIALWKKYNLKSVLCRDDKILYILFADMAELADALDLGSSGRPCRFESCYPQV